MTMNRLRFLFASYCLLLLTACGSSRVAVPVDDRTALPDEPIELSDSDLADNSQISIDSSADISNQANKPESLKLQQSESLSNQSQATAKPEPIVLAMLNKAEKHMAAGEVEQAIDSLERAARLKPKDPWLWHSMAVLRLQTKEWGEAINLAQKSISLSGGQQKLLAGNWQIILDAKKALGDETGVIEAEKKLRLYQPVLTS